MCNVNLLNQPLFFAVLYGYIISIKAPSIAGFFYRGIRRGECSACHPVLLLSSLHVIWYSFCSLHNGLQWLRSSGGDGMDVYKGGCGGTLVCPFNYSRLFLKQEQMKSTCKQIKLTGSSLFLKIGFV